MNRILYHNNDGEYRIGDHVLINNGVKESDSMRTYVDEEHPTLEIISIRGMRSDNFIGNSTVALRSWDNRNTERTGWAIQPLEGVIGCYKCKSSCKSDEVCAFFQELNK